MSGSKAVALIAGLTVALIAPSTSSAERNATSLTIRLLAVPSSFRLTVDLPPKKDLNKGDRFAVTDVLRNAAPQFGRPKGAVVGRDAVTGTLVSATAARVTVRAALPGGTVFATGRVGSEPKSRIAITGGTGRFQNALGTATEVQLSGERTLDTYFVRLR